MDPTAIGPADDSAARPPAPRDDTLHLPPGFTRHVVSAAAIVLSLHAICALALALAAAVGG